MPQYWFRDFAPREVRPAGILSPAEFASYETAVEEANHWIEETGVQVAHLETVVLPNIWSHHEEGTTDASLGTRDLMPSHWHQILRVWYIDDERHTAHDAPRAADADIESPPPIDP